MTAPAEQPPVEITDEMRMAAYRVARAKSEEIGHGLVDDRIVDVALAAVAPLIAAQVRGEVTQEIAEALDKLASTTRAHHVGAEDYATAYAWAAMEARRRAAGVAADEAEERTAVAESERVWTGNTSSSKEPMK